MVLVFGYDVRFGSIATELRCPATSALPPLATETRSLADMALAVVGGDPIPSQTDDENVQISQVAGGAAEPDDLST